MSPNGSKLFDLMPALYRLKDAQIAQAKNQTQGPLQSLLMLVEEQLAIVAEDLDQLYDDQFIETCASWVIPYIGDLIGYQSVHGVAPAVASPRAEVAHTISFRRRKGTVLVLEQLARDVTGWGAHAVEFFKILATTQFMNHIRPHNFYAPDLRRWQPRAYMNTGFDRTAHKVDVRRIAVERGRYNIQNIGIFLWSLNAYSLTKSPAVAIAGSNTCFRFNSLGLDAPLFNNPVSQGADITAPATRINVPAVMLRRELCQDLAAVEKTNPAALNYDPGNSLALYINGALVVPAKVQVCDLSGPDGSWNNQPSASSPFSAAIDPELGRIALPPPAAGMNPNVVASFFYGFNGDMGGGEYSRAATFSASPEQAVVRVPGDYPTVSAALTALPGDGVVEITDSGRYQESGGLAVSVKANGHIELRAADGCRPTLILGKEMTVTGGAESIFDLNGLVIAGAALQAPASGSNLAQLGVTHCTLVPGSAPALLASPAGLNVVIQKSILGGLQVNALATAAISDSIVDATDPTGVAYVGEQNGPGGALTLQGCTVIGKVYASLFTLVSDSIVWAALAPADSWQAPLWATRKQQGCVRFSYLPAGSITPRQFQCVEQGPGSPQPLFYSLRYGDPAYSKLSPSTDNAIRRGADDGGEMGAFHFLLAPLRETDLRVRMQEYMPVGLEFGIFYQN
ncbi:MAG TPA: hypothetical protein VIY49_38070 [Bryobacteraceae bacterium]